MFDWFRDMTQELGGIDSNLAKKERNEKKELKKQHRFIFSSGIKILFIVLSVLYIAIAGSTIVALKNTSGSFPIILKFIIMSVLAIVVIISLSIGKKKGEIVALATSFIFIIGLYLSVVLV